MLREGHLGLGLLAFLPFGALFLLGLGRLDLFVVGLVAMVAGATSPDNDLQPPLKYLCKHRGWTHTIWFAGGASLGAAGLLVAIDHVLLTPRWMMLEQYRSVSWELVVVAGVLTGVGVLSHLVGDSLTPRGIKPYHPVTPRGVAPITVSTKTYALGVTKSSSSLTNTLLLASGAVGIVALILVGTPP